MIVATTAISHLLEDLQLSTAFNVVLHVSQLQQPDEYAVILQQASGLSSEAAASISTAITQPLGIKQLLQVAEMARANGDGVITPDGFMECLNDCGF